jgi:hypothetical protein
MQRTISTRRPGFKHLLDDRCEIVAERCCFA